MSLVEISRALTAPNITNNRHVAIITVCCKIVIDYTESFFLFQPHFHLSDMKYVSDKEMSEEGTTIPDYIELSVNEELDKSYLLSLDKPHL